MTSIASTHLEPNAAMAAVVVSIMQQTQAVHGLGPFFLQLHLDESRHLQLQFLLGLCGLVAIGREEHAAGMQNLVVAKHGE